MANKDGMAKNLEVVEKEIDDYKVVVGQVVERAKNTEGFARKIHVLSGLGPDMHRVMARTLWYGSLLLTVAALIGLGVWWVV